MSSESPRNVFSRMFRPAGEGRPWYQVSLLSLLILMTLVALVLGLWWMFAPFVATIVYFGGIGLLMVGAAALDRRVGL